MLVGRTIYLAVVFDLFLKFLLGKGTFVKSPQLQNCKFLEKPRQRPYFINILEKSLATSPSLEGVNIPVHGNRFDSSKELKIRR